MPRGWAGSKGKGGGRECTQVHTHHPSRALQGIQNTVALRATSPKHTLRNCLVRANFVLGGGTLWPTQQSAGYAILGPAAPRLVATSVVFQVREIETDGDR